MAIRVVEVLKLGIWVAGIHLDRELANTCIATLLCSATHNGVFALLFKVDLSAEHLQIADASLRQHPPLIDLSHQLALFARDHPARQVIALERAARVFRLGQGEVARRRCINSQLELRHVRELLARVASSTLSNPLTGELYLIPAGLL